MRKIGGVLLAAAVALPLFVMVAPGGAAGAGQTCSKLTGTVKFKPPLPKDRQLEEGHHDLHGHRGQALGLHRPGRRVGHGLADRED